MVLGSRGCEGVEHRDEWMLEGLVLVGVRVMGDVLLLEGLVGSVWSCDG